MCCILVVLDGLYFGCDFMGCILVEFCQVVFCLCFDGLYFYWCCEEEEKYLFDN